MMVLSRTGVNVGITFVHCVIRPGSLPVMGSHAHHVETRVRITESENELTKLQWIGWRRSIGNHGVELQSRGISTVSEGVNSSRRYGV